MVDQWNSELLNSTLLHSLCTMQIATSKLENTCPVSKASSIFSSRWAFSVVHNLLTGKKRFSELKRLVGKGQSVTSSSLSRVLKKLECEKIIRRIVEPEPTVKVYYELTSKGRDLQGVLDELYIWGVKHLKNTC